MGEPKIRKLMEPAGPVSGAFVESRAFISGLMGPVGGGKTVAGIARCFKIADRQMPVWDEKRRAYVKKCRIGAVRDTYPNLDRTLIKTWHQWIPKELGRWSGDAPRTHSFTMSMGRRGQKGFHLIDMEMLFAGIGDNAVEDVLRGWELTAFWPNEWDLTPPDLLEFAVGRVGRYPSRAADGAPCVLPQIFGDFNAPDEDNHLYDLFVNHEIDPELERAIALETGGNQPLIEFFEQPGGLEDVAENLQNLEGGRVYYLKQKAMMRSQDKIRRMIDNKWGPVRDGMPVYDVFSDARHVAKEPLEPVRGLPLRIGMDAGLTPAAVIGQRNSLGQTRILAELAVFVEGEGELSMTTGPTAFGEALADLLATRFPGFPIEFAAVDPAADRGTDGSGNELNWLQYAARASRLNIRPAPVPDNDIHVRLEAVRRPLTRSIDSGQPALLISPTCKLLRRGFNGGYKYRRTALAGGDHRYENKPDKKSPYSHVHDALQYLMVTSGEGRMIGAHGDGGAGAHRPRVHVVSDYDPFS